MDMIITHGLSTTPSLRCLQLSYMFANNNKHPQLIKMFFPCFSQYLIQPSRYVYETSKFDGQVCTHVFTCL